MSVEKAIEVGNLLHEAKEELAHGEFLPWLSSNFEMSHMQATRYMKLYTYEDKCNNMLSLQEAYQQIETIERQEKKEQEKKDNTILYQYLKTGIKPVGWERRHDYLYKKHLDAEELERKKQQIAEEKKKISGDGFDYDEMHRKSEENSKILETFIDILNNDEAKTSHIKLDNYNDNIQQKDVIKILDSYIFSADSVSRQLELTNNLIKYLRKISIDLNRQ